MPEENFWTLWCKGRWTETETPTIQLGATPSRLTSSHLHHPPFLQAGCPSYRPTNSVKALKATSAASNSKHKTSCTERHSEQPSSGVTVLACDASLYYSAPSRSVKYCDERDCMSVHISVHVVCPFTISETTCLPPHHQNRFMALFPGPPGWAGARRELLDFVVQREINRGRHTDYPAGHHSIRTNQCPPPPSPHV